MTDDLRTAHSIIARAEADLGRLSDGQKRDLLMDNTEWNSDVVRAIVEVLKSDPLSICRKWVSRIGLGFHPDTRGKDYSPALSAADVKEYDRDMETLFGAGGDPYEFAVIAMEEPERETEGHSPFVTWCQIWEGDRAAILIEYDNRQNAYAFSQERIFYINN